MEAIAKIKLSHEAFTEIIDQSIGTHWDQEVFSTEDDWQRNLNRSDVIHQWDPERDIVGKRLDRQAIQIRIRGTVIRKYVSDYIIGVEDVSPLVHEIGRIRKSGASDYPELPEERAYTIPEELFKKLGCQR